MNDGFAIYFGVMFAVSLVLTGLGATALLTYVRRTWQLMRSERDGSPQERLLDGVDHLQNQMSVMNERLERLESRLERAGSLAELEPPSRGPHP